MYIVFRSTDVQTWLAGKATAYLSHELNTKVHVGGLDIAWFMDVIIEDLVIEDHNHAILLKTPDLQVDIININLKSKHLQLKNIKLSQAEINVIKYQSDSVLNYSFLIDYFKGDGKQTATNPWAISIESLNVDGTTFRFDDVNKTKLSKFIDYNHLELVNINVDVRRIIFNSDSATASVYNLSAIEHSGLTLHKFSGDINFNQHNLAVKNLQLISAGSNVKADLQFTFNNLNAFNYLFDSVTINANFGPSIIELDEIKYFSSETSGMENRIHFNGNVKGKISSLKARDFHFSFGSNSSFDGEISMDGLPDIQETFIHLKVKKLITDYNDITSINLPGGTSIKLPVEVKRIGIIDISGFFTGFIYDFVSSANFNTSLGRLETDISLQTGKGRILKYNGQFNLKNWDLGKNFEIEDKVGTVDLSSSLNGEILDSKHNKVHLDAIIEHIEILGNEFNGISINGLLNDRLFNGNMKVRDELIKLDFIGMVDFTDTIPHMNFTASIENAYLQKLNLWKRDSTARISTTIDLNFTGSNIDNLIGYLQFDSTSYFEKGKLYFLNNVELAVTENISQIKKLSLESDLVDASFNGKFSYADFYNSLSNIMYSYLPSLQVEAQKQNEIKEAQLFDYNIQIKNLKPITDLFLPEFTLKSKAVIFGSYNSTDNDIILNGNAGEFWYKGIKFSKWFARGKNTGNSLQFVTGVSSANVQQSVKDTTNRWGMENLSFTALMQGDTIKYDLNWDDEIPENFNTGEINGFFSFTNTPKINCRFNNFDVVVNKMPWKAFQQNDVIIDSTSVFVDKIDIISKTQKLQLSGKISEDQEDIFTLGFENLDISNADLLMKVKNVDFDGVLTGVITLRDLYKTQQLEASVDIMDFTFNKERMGDATIKSNWNQDIAALNISADILYKGNLSTHLPISAKGLIYLRNRPEGNFDLNVKVANYKLASLNPFLKGIASGIKGYANGNLKLEGTFEKPIITGELDLLRTQMKIDYLNVTYSFAHNVIIESNSIKADDVIIYDSLGNSGNCDFVLTHQNFRKIKMNIDVSANSISSLNTTYKNNNLFYGTVFGTGKVNINGSLSDININITASPDPNTNIYIPINLAVDAKEKSFIRFLSSKPSDSESPVTYEPKTSGTNVNINLNVTRDASLQLFLPENIGNIKTSGSGDIQMGVNKQGEMSIYGDYWMERGTFLFTLGNVINRSFSIQNGSSISFNGSPYEADINLSAVYRLRASLKGLPELSEYSNQTVPVDCIIRLKENLYNPEISFSIVLPEADNELNQLVFASIDTSNQVIMTEQIVSLLVLKTFAFTSSSNLATSVGSSSIEVLTDQLSNMLSQLSDDVDIGVKYRSENALTDEEVEVALSTNFFNNRVSIDGNLGIYTANSTQEANNIVGDVVVDVKITPDGRFRVKAFNKSQQRFDISSVYAPYKQGIGVYYRYEFDKISDIFSKKRLKILSK